MVDVRVTMQGVVRRSRNMTLPVLLLGAHAARQQLTPQKISFALVTILESIYNHVLYYKEDIMMSCTFMKI